MHPLDRAKARIKGKDLRIVFPEGADERVLRAAFRLATEYPGIHPALVGDPQALSALAAADHISMRGIQVIDPATFEGVEALAQLYRRNRPDTSMAIARRFARKPMFCAGLLLKQGWADAMVAGVNCPTARVVEAALLTVGLQPGVTVPSSFFIMILKDRSDYFIFSDCAVNVDPGVDDLAAIGVASARSYVELVGEDPRTAFLSFSTHGSAQHPQARKTRDAAELAHALCPQYKFDGELQADAALVERVAAAKVKGNSAVAGRANVLVFPDLNAANIGCKLVQHLGGAMALGPFLQGFAAPVSDLSRGATVQDIVDTAIITASRAV
ncbi:MAG: phosphotransacetylase [Micropepsaceae bacterium]